VTSAAQLARRVDSFCARLNSGLSAVALALALVTVVALAYRFPPSVPQFDLETGTSPNDF
jgi:hypothetical protein